MMPNGTLSMLVALRVIENTETFLPGRGLEAASVGVRRGSAVSSDVASTFPQQIHPCCTSDPSTFQDCFAQVTPSFGKTVLPFLAFKRSNSPSSLSKNSSP